MSQWEMVKLGDVCSLVTKGTTPTTLGYSFTDSGIPFLRAQNLVNGFVDIDVDPLYIDEKTHKALSRSTIQSGDVLIAIAGTIGRTALVQSSVPIANCNQAVAILRSSPMLQPAYLQHTLRSDSVVQQIYNSKVTATISNLSLGEIKKLEIPLPPLDEQQRIVNRLNLAQRLIDQRKTQITLIDELVQALFYEMFGDPVKNEKGWECKELSEITHFENGDRSSNYPSGYDILKSGVLFFGTQNIGSDGYFNPSDLKYISLGKFNSLSRGKLNQGDLVISLRGSVGNTCVFYSDEYNTGFINAQLMIIRPNSFLNNLFLLSYLRLNKILSTIKEMGSGSAVPQLTASQLKTFKIPLPPLALQQTFAERVQQFEALKQQMQTGLAELEQAFQALMQEAFAG